MDEKSQESQPDLFQDFSAAAKKPERFPAIAKTQKPILISTTLEQLLTLSVVVILGLCGIFFLGVLRGKALNKPAAPAPAPAVSQRTLPVPPTAAPAPAVPKPAILASISQKPYTIQLVTHRKKEFAEAEMAALRKMGLVTFLIPSGGYFQVCVGQYASKEEAKKDLLRFSARYKDSYLRRR